MYRMVLFLNVWSYKCKCREWFYPWMYGRYFFLLLLWELSCLLSCFSWSILPNILFQNIFRIRFLFTDSSFLYLPSLLPLYNIDIQTDMKIFINIRDLVDFKMSQRLGPYFYIANLIILICRFLHFRISSHRFWREKLYKTFNDQNGK